ncbi:MAG: hypothetical protein HZA46_17645 [Planctomycetales bacterium]|nr:hypothetical protein [Planctomycetales bacterium]
MFRRCLVAAATILIAALPQVVWACPMCAETVAADDNLPKAYMYSILFMMGMPAILASGFGFAFYRLVKKQQALHAAAMAAVAETQSEPEPVEELVGSVAD